VDDRLDLPLVFGAQGQNVATGALGNEILLQHASACRVSQVAVKAVHQAGMNNLYFRAYVSQFGRGAVEHLTAFADRAVDEIDQSLAIRETSGESRQGGSSFSVVEQHAASSAGKDQGITDGEEVARFESYAVQSLIREGCQVHRALEADAVI